VGSGRVTRVLAGRSRVQIPVGVRYFFSRKSPDRLWSQPILLFNGHWDQCGRSVKLTAHLHLMSCLRMSVIIPLLPLYAFRAWTGNIFPFLALPLPLPLPLS